MNVTKADLQQYGSLLNRMCPTQSFDSWTSSQSFLASEEGNSSRNRDTGPTLNLQRSCAPRDSTRHPIETTHYAITVPVQSSRPPEDRRNSA